MIYLNFRLVRQILCEQGFAEKRWTREALLVRFQIPLFSNDTKTMIRLCTMYMLQCNIVHQLNS